HRKPKAYSRYNFRREPKTDSYRCPQGRRMIFSQFHDYEYADGQTTRRREYKCEYSTDCPVRAGCSYGQGPRTISFIPRLEQWKNRVSELLSQNKKAQTLMGQRGAQIEAVFGQLKENDRLRRLTMRGKRMVETEVGLKAI